MVLFRWFKQILFGSRAANLPKERGAQRDWINAANRHWQLRWHDLFDVDGDLIAAGEFDRPHPLPGEVNCDFRLIFGLPRATSKTRQECFALFPSGPEMHRRFQEFLSSKPVALSETEARERLTRVVALIEEIGPNEDVDLSKVRVVDRDTEGGLGELCNTDDFTVLLEKNLLPNYPVEELTKIAAEFFLTEPLYAAAGNFYQVSNWVTAAMTGGLTDKLQSELYKLWAGGWQVALGPDGVILASRKI